MVSTEEVRNALYNACSLIVAANDDKNLVIIKDEICNFKEGETISIFELFSSIRKFIHEKSYKRFDKIFNTERIVDILTDDNRACLTPEFQLKLGDEYKPYQFEVIRNNGLVLITIRRADRAYSMLENATNMMHTIMLKILRINVTDDSYDDIKVKEEGNRPHHLSEWWKKFAKYNVAEDDKKDFLDFGSNLGNLYKSYGEMPKGVVYRRCVNGAEYRWSVLYAVPTKEYTKDNKQMYIFVIDIQHQYIMQAEKNRRLGIDKYYDIETGLHNKRAFENRVARLHGQKASLAWICLRDETPAEYNDRESYVKSTANMIIDEYGEDRCYRLNENEFVVLNVGSHRLDANISCNVMFGAAYANSDEDYCNLYDNAVKDATW